MADSPLQLRVAELGKNSFHAGELSLDCWKSLEAAAAVPDDRKLTKRSNDFFC